MTNINEMADKWKDQLQNKQPGHSLLTEHLLSLYFGVSQTGSAEFLLITDDKPDFPEFSEVVEVKRGKRYDDTWALVLSLTDSSLEDAFVGLCFELARISQLESSHEVALDVFYKTLLQWQQILRAKSFRKLTNDQKRGLVGELWFATRVLATKYQGGDVVMSWTGPLGSQHDFRTPSQQIFEIKTVHPNPRNVKISSVEQLDPADGSELHLVLVTVNKFDVKSDQTITLSALAADFYELLSPNAKHVAILDKAFESLGFDHTDEIYKQEHYLVTNLDFHLVSENFPRLRTKDIPGGIANVKYELKIASLPGPALPESDINF
ncbi:PD-(D/E)XK motif protein [Aurantimicrobium minutum]|uniref:PD-(D/E)XK motif protein n=1 Tax=Aurantimicrobium minutum TaxID=708131 RepID=UPI00247536C5|nr:PD-(D/E)XK motif protein [Aurantimicrobium minutum]MDH6536928.1 hypothetical protein [Aurantimicrobium minutum]